MIQENQSLFEEQFNREILASERLRATILALIGVVMLTILFTVLVVSPDIFPLEFEHHIGALSFKHWLIVVLVFIIAYESAGRLVINHFIRSDKHVPSIAQYINVIVEISFPSFLILCYASSADPALAFSSPPSVLYYLLIMLTALKLDFKLCVFTGFLAACEYGALSLIFLENAHMNQYCSALLLHAPNES